MTLLSSQNVSPSQLHPNPWNTNIVPAENEAKIDASIKRFGFFKPVIVRTLLSGKFEIIGGEHRWASAKRLKLDLIPIVDLGVISDAKAKEIGIVDNGRYGNDDVLGLAELLDGLGEISELSTFLPYSDNEFASIFASTSIALDDLDMPEDEDMTPSAPREKVIQTHAIMRFKVPTGDVASITERIEKVMKTQRFTDEDSLANAGNALVHIFQKSEH